MAQGSGIVRQTAWYRKNYPTFSDALALVRKELWAQEEAFCGSAQQTDTVKVPRELIERLVGQLERVRLFVAHFVPLTSHPLFGERGWHTLL
jgi:hypothetical protein